MTFAENVKKLAGSCFYQLRQLRTVRRSLTTDAETTLVHALISSRVDYCNSVLYGMCEAHLRPLQSVQNAAARLITGKRNHAGRPPLAASETTHTVQTVFAGQ